jgi:hypothetical protein
MTTFSSIPAYFLGTACISRGLLAILSPAKEYAHVGLPLSPSAAPAPSEYDGAPHGSVSPLMYFKGIREVSYGAMMVALQYQGFEGALTSIVAILSLVRMGDGWVVWKEGGEELRHRAGGHWATGVAFLGWAVWRVVKTARRV